MATAQVLAGNVARITTTLTRPTGSTTDVNPSTAKMAVTSFTGVTTALVPTVTYPDASTMVATADWATADTLPGGLYTVTVDTAGNLAAAAEQRVRVLTRTEPVVP